MPVARDLIISTIKELLARRGDLDVEVHPDADLFDDLGLDSLEVAEVSAVLEEQLGDDPFSSGRTPKTVADVIEFYSPVATDGP